MTRRVRALRSARTGASETRSGASSVAVRPVRRGVPPRALRLHKRERNQQELHVTNHAGFFRIIYFSFVRFKLAGDSRRRLRQGARSTLPRGSAGTSCSTRLRKTYLYSTQQASPGAHSTRHPTRRDQRLRLKIFAGERGPSLDEELAKWIFSNRSQLTSL